MKRLRTCLVALVAVSLLLSACASQPASQTDPNSSGPVSLGKGAVAMVNGSPITDQEFAQRVKVYEVYYGQNLSDPQTQNLLLDRYVNEVLLIEEAGKRGITSSDQEAASLLAYFNAVMAQAYGGADVLAEVKKAKGIVDADIQKALAATLLLDRLGEQLGSGITISDAEIQSYYQTNLSTEFTVTEEQVRASHILVASEAKARELLERIKNGEDFAKLAQENSTDGSAANGGDLGYFGKGKMVEPFEKAAFALAKVNDVSEPVQTQFGWHLIKLTGRRSPGTIPLDEVRSSIAAQLKAEKIDAEIDKLAQALRSQATVELVDLTKK